MTLVVGIKCSDGIVIGADGAATLGSLGQRTVRQPIRKLELIDDCIVLGISGPVGLGQRYKGAIEDLWENKGLSGQKPHEAMTTMRKTLWEHCGIELEVAKHAQQALGNISRESAVAQAIIAVPISKKPCLFQFDHQGAPEEATEDLPFVAIGSGQSIADPFLAFLRRVFWPDRIPSIGEGIFASLWALEHAIQTNPGGVSNPKQIMRLTKEEKGWQARELTEQEMQEHLEAITVAEQKLSTFREEFQDDEDDSNGAIPPSPQDVASPETAE